MPVPVLPDTIAVVREALLAQTTLTATAVGTRMYDRIPAGATDANFPMLTIGIVDDAELEWYAIGALVQVDVWGAGPSSDDEQQAYSIARTIRAVARDLKGTWATGTIRSSAVDTIVPAPDPDNGRARFVVTLLVETQP